MKFTIPTFNPTLFKGRSICILKNIRVLNILTFWEIIRTKNYTLLDRDYFIGKRYSQQQEKDFELAWEKICDEYFLAKDDARSKVHLRNSNLERILQHKIKAFNEAYELLTKVSRLVHLVDITKLAEMLTEVYALIIKLEPKTNIDLKKSLDSNIKATASVLNALINKYHNTYKKKDKNLKEEMFNGFEVCASIEQILERPLGDLSKIMVAQFISYEKQAHKKVVSNNRKNNLRNGK